METINKYLHDNRYSKASKFVHSIINIKYNFHKNMNDNDTLMQGKEQI